MGKFVARAILAVVPDFVERRFGTDYLLLAPIPKTLANVFARVLQS